MRDTRVGPLFQSLLLLLFATVWVNPAVCQTTLPDASSRVIYGEDGGGKVLVIGAVTNVPKYNYGQMQGISQYMLERLTDFGIKSVEVFTVDSEEKMVELLKGGRVDWVAATPYAALMYERLAGGEFLATKKTRGRASYRSVFFTRKDSGIKSLADLVDKVIAFEKVGSTTAYFLPATEILSQGYTLVKLDSPRDRPPKGTIGYVLSGDELNSSTWVHKNITAAAAFSNADWDSDWRMPQGFRDDLVIFHETNEVPRSVEIVRGDLDEVLKAKVKSILFNANQDEEAIEALQGYYRASDFSELTEEQHSALALIRQNMLTFETMLESPESAKSLSDGLPVLKEIEKNATHEKN